MNRERPGALPAIREGGTPAGAERPQTPFLSRVIHEYVDYNGHMSEAYYVLIFGHATDAFYDHVGLDHAYREQHRISIYTVEAHIRYLIEAHDGDALHIATRVLAYDSKRLRLHHTMRRGTDTLAVTELMLLHVDKTALRATPFHPEPLARIAAVAAAQASAPPPEAATSRHWGA